MGEWIWCATRKYEGRTTDRIHAFGRALAQGMIRNKVGLEGPAKWGQVEAAPMEQYNLMNAPDDVEVSVRKTLVHGEPVEESA